jgi:hypothetical protein
MRTLVSTGFGERVGTAGFTAWRAASSSVLENLMPLAGFVFVAVAVMGQILST